MDACKITVLMSVYNSQRYIDESVQSIMAQSFKDFEFIIIDDGSFDKTPEILKRYQDIDPRILVLRNETNMGLTRSLNRGIRHARGEYIARQDADDISMPERLEKQLYFMEHNKDYSCVGTFYTVINSRGKARYNMRLPVKYNEIKKWLNTINPLCHGSVIFRRDAAYSAGLYREDYLYSQDYAFWHALCKTHKLGNIPEFLYKLRLYPESSSTRNKLRQWESVFTIRKDLGLLGDGQKYDSRFVSDEMFAYAVFCYKMGMWRLSISNLLAGISCRVFPLSKELKMERPTGVCMVTGAFYPEISGGGLQCRTLIDALKYKNFRFYVLTTANESLSRDKNFSIDITRVVIRKINPLNKLRAILQFTYAFLKRLDKIDIVHLHGFSDKTLLIILLAKIFNKRIIQKITSLGDDDPVSLLKRPLGRIKRIFFSSADIFVTINPVMSGRFLAAGFPKDKLVDIPNGVDTDRFHPLKDIQEKSALRDELILPKNALIITFVGFFSKDKAPDLLLEAYKDLRKKFAGKDIRLLFIGSSVGTYFEIDTDLVMRVKRQVNDKGMGKDVIFIEKTLQIEKYYMASDIFVLCSYREGLPNALLEAMSTGLACVSSAISGVSDFLISHEKEGLLFEPGNVSALSDAISILIRDGRRSAELGYNARQKILRNFTLEQLASNYDSLYKRLANKVTAYNCKR